MTHVIEQDREEGSSSAAILPWEAEPYRLWSLLDMFRYNVALVVQMTRMLAEVEAKSHVHAVAPTLGMEILRAFCSQINFTLTDEFSARATAATTETLLATTQPQLQEFLQTLSEYVHHTGLPMRWHGKVRRIQDSLKGSDSKKMQILVGELIEDIAEELQEPFFLAISPSSRDYYEQREPLFGAKVEQVFPDSAREIAAAGRCLALDEWTAAVFHLMRVLECGLRPLAARFNVPFAVDSWHRVISGIEDGITSLRNKQSLTNQDRRDITNFSDAASQFRHFKDAWRNHVSHAREYYDQREAEKVWTHVRDFMQTMAEIV